MHDEKNYKIDLLRRTKKRVSNATNDTYEKKFLMLTIREKLTKKKSKFARKSMTKQSFVQKKIIKKKRRRRDAFNVEKTKNRKI